MSRLLLIALVGLLNGCVSVLIDSNTNYDALPRFNRILVVAKIDRDDRAYLLEFERAFPLQYEVCAISANKLAFGNPD